MNAKLLLATCAIVLTATALALSQRERAAPDRPDVLTARSLHLVDADGRRRIVMETMPDGTATMTMLDTEGAVHMALRVGPEGGSHILMFDPKDRLRIDIQSRSAVSLNLLDANGATGIGMSGGDHAFSFSVQQTPTIPIKNDKND